MGKNIISPNWELGAMRGGVNMALKNILALTDRLENLRRLLEPRHRPFEEKAKIRELRQALEGSIEDTAEEIQLLYKLLQDYEQEVKKL